MLIQSFTRHSYRSNQRCRVVIVYSYSLLCSFWCTLVPPALRTMSSFLHLLAVFLILFLILDHFIMYALIFQLELVPFFLGLLHLYLEHLHGLIVHRVLVLIWTCGCCRSERRRSDHGSTDGAGVDRHLRLHHQTFKHVDTFLSCHFLLLKLVFGPVKELKHVKAVPYGCLSELLDLVKSENEWFVSQVVMLVNH